MKNFEIKKIYPSRKHERDVHASVDRSFIDSLEERLRGAQGMEDGDKKNEILILIHFDCARDFLSKQWGADNLSNIENIRLKTIVRECFSEQGRDFDIGTEAAARWLFESYGINEQDIPNIYVIKDFASDRVLDTYPIDMRDLAKRKEKELNKQGCNVYCDIIIPSDFKEYLKRLREKAHLL